MEVCTDLSAVVDEFAAVKAQIADLEERKEALKAMILGSMEESIKGTSHKVSVTWVCPRPAPNYKAVVEYLKVGQKTLDLFMVEKSPYATVRVYGR